jgi:dihydroflavonol-4-reductase
MSVGSSAVITGASGHIGGRVASLLLDRGYDVTLLVRRRTAHVERLAERGAEVIVCDLSRPDTYGAALHRRCVLFHLAAENTLDTSDERRVIAATHGLTQIVVSAALDAGVRTAIYTSSVVVLGRSDKPSRLLRETDEVSAPESPYVKGKLLAEQWIAQRVAEGHDLRRVYPSWVVGPGDPRTTPPHRFLLDYACRGQRSYVGGGVSIAHVDDVALGHVFAYERGKPGQQYVLSGENVTFLDLYRHLAKRFGHSPPAFRIPKRALVATAKVLGRFSPIDAAYAEAVADRYSWYDCSKARHELGYAPRNLEATLGDVGIDIRKRLIGTIRLGFRRTTAVAAGKERGRLLITGFPGWLGNRAVDILMNGDRHGRNRTDRPVRLLVQPHLKPLVPALPENYEVVEGDVTDKVSVVQALGDVSAVWHLAGVIYPSELSLYDQVNVEGTRNVATACMERGVQRILYMSTDSCCGYTPRSRLFSPDEPPRPYKAYGRSKHAGEAFLLRQTAEGRLRATSLRGFWFFGPNVPPRNLGFLRSFRWPFQIVFGDGTNRRSISHVDDLVDAFCRAESADASVGKWYWLPTFLEPQTVDEIYSMIGVAAGKPARCLHVPNLLCEVLGGVDSFMARVFGRLNATVHAAGKFHKTIATDAHGAAPAHRDFGWQPRIQACDIQEEIRAALNGQ